ncbi:MAG: hypothetical protein KatS3mg016_0509 [Fimbriimonadales bacterium]|nr:MAG: hypothetical protein KatS3mg016_0509 [Fimbriimonadales bacterium]
MIHYMLYALFILGLIIEITSVYLDWRIMTGKGKTSSAWGVACGFFVFFGTYGMLLGIRRNEPFILTNELLVALLLMGFQIVFHLFVVPIVGRYWRNRKR